MALDLERLRRDVIALESTQAAQGQPSGAMAVVRAHLTEIERLKQEGASWVDIATALAGQGVRRRDGKPITGRRLTALIDSIRRQDVRKRNAMARRASRGDLATTSPVTSRQPPETRAPRLSRMAREPAVEAAPPAPEHRTAEQMRRDGLAELNDILQGKKR